MTKFIDVSNDTKEVKKETVFTHELTPSSGWRKTSVIPKMYGLVSYIGNCNTDGDMFFSVSDQGNINIFKGIKGDEFN